METTSNHKREQTPMKNFKASDNTAAEHFSLVNSGFIKEYRKMTPSFFDNKTGFKDPLLAESIADWLEEKNCPDMAKNWRNIAAIKRKYYH